MQIKIHRGTHQIGGSITEISTKKTKIIIDMGEELPNNEKAIQNIEISGLTQGEIDYDAVLFTHYHGDHIGLYKKILPGIPLYMGKAAKEIYSKLAEYIDKESLPIIEKFETFEIGKKVVIGDITITPYLIDHSAYDAYMFLIEANNKSVLHTGDFRNHGFRGRKLILMLKKYVKKGVDVLITEGTMLSRDDIHIKSESQIMNEAKKLIEESNKKYVFVLCSSTNIDRIAGFYKANPKGRDFLCDGYQSEVLDIVRKYAKDRTEFYEFKYKLKYGKNLDERIREKGFCMLVRNNDYFKNIISEFDKEDYLFFYSMWDGYLKREDTKIASLVDFLEDIDYVVLHTSGHATQEAILGVCEQLEPKVIIPMHSENPEKLKDVLKGFNVKILNDGEVFEVV